MKKKLVCAVFLLVLISGGLVACDKREETADTYEKVEQELGDEYVEETAVDTEAQEESAVEDDTPGETAEPEDNVDTAVDFEQVIIPAYESYVIENYGRMDSEPYSFIFLDNDTVPELVVRGDCCAAGNLICAYVNDSVVSVRLYRSNFSFLEKQNLVCNSDGNMGYYYDDVYSIQDGAFVCLAEGEWQEARGEDGYWILDENENMVYDYCWNGQAVSCEEYYKSLSQIFDEEKAVSVSDLNYYSSIQEAYENLGKTTFSELLSHITRFELENGVLAVETDYDKMIKYPVAENCAWEKTSIGMEVPGVYGTWTYEELKECIDATRDAYIENNYEFDSPGTLVVEMEDNLIVRIYTVSS